MKQRFVHAHRRRLTMESAWSRGNADGERGYVLVLVSATMTVLLAAAGFSLDLGSWFREATRMQSAVDAAALAGVVYMPGNFTKASATAQTLMTKNGFTHGSNGVSVTVSSVSGNSRRLKVCATDTQVEVYMTKVVNANPVISKCAVSEWVTPISMGSPLNQLDQTTLGVWPAVNGYCSATEDGDEILSGWRGMFPDHTWNTYTGCPPGAPLDANPTYDAHGYDYTIDVKVAGSTTIQVYDAQWGGGSSLDGTQGNGTTIVNTTYAGSWDSNTPLDLSDDVSLGSVTVASGAATYLSQWKTLFTVSQPGRYTMTVTVSKAAESHGSNSFGIRAYQGGSFSLCSSESWASNYNANCVQVSARDHLGVNAQVAASTASFYLASVDPIYAGKQMVVGLFDPSEGGQSIEILDPNGNPVSFTWSTTDNLPTAAPGALAYSGSGTLLDVSGSATPIPSYRRNPGKFNDRKVVAIVDLPTNYATAYCTPTCKTWWKLRYKFGSGSVSDRTTWDVSVIGDPVRLV